MPVIRIRASTPADGPRVIDIWRGAVDATHHFLTHDDRRAIETEVVAFLPHAPLDRAIDEAGRAIAFMMLNDAHIEALFVDPVHRGTGVGRALVEDARRRHAALSVDVNEQNPQALGLYGKLGFELCGRSDTDGQGRRYPLIHLRSGTDATSIAQI